MPQNRRTFESATLHGLPVLAIAEGRILGKVKDEIFDPRAHTLLGVTVALAGAGDANFLDRLRVKRLGPFALTVLNSSDLQELAEHQRANEVFMSGVRLRGAAVMTDIGEQIGKIDRIWIDDAGTVMKYRCSTGGFGIGRSHDILPDDIAVVGEDAVIVSADALGPPGREPAVRGTQTQDESASVR